MHSGPKHKENPPKPAPRKRKKQKRAKLTDPLTRLQRKAYWLIALGGARWGENELDESNVVRASVEELLKTARPYHRQKAEGFLRELQKATLQVLERNSQTRRGTGAQNDHPDRNRITDYSAAGGHITYATPRK
jgi:hypothetical protein